MREIRKNGTPRRADLNFHKLRGGEGITRGGRGNRKLKLAPRRSARIAEQGGPPRSARELPSAYERRVKNGEPARREQALLAEDAPSFGNTKRKRPGGKNNRFRLTNQSRNRLSS